MTPIIYHSACPEDKRGDRVVDVPQAEVLGAALQGSLTKSRGGDWFAVS
jgi:hypothetical protein